MFPKRKFSFTKILKQIVSNVEVPSKLDNSTNRHFRKGKKENPVVDDKCNFPTRKKIHLSKTEEFKGRHCHHKVVILRSSRKFLKINLQT